jgi:hypothetical protein
MLLTLATLEIFIFYSLVLARAHRVQMEGVDGDWRTRGKATSLVRGYDVVGSLPGHPYHDNSTNRSPKQSMIELRPKSSRGS